MGDMDTAEPDIGNVDMAEPDMTELDMGACSMSLIGTSCTGEGLGQCGVGIYQCEDETLVCLLNEPSPELCDTLDNDCDGQVDEDLGGEQCTLGLGVCQTDGLIACINGDLSCQVDNMPSPSTDDQSCDGLDNDCDGRSDEDYQQSVVNCGV